MAKPSKPFEYMGRTAKIDGQVSSAGDPFGRFGPPRSDDPEKRRRTLARKRKRAQGRKP